MAGTELAIYLHIPFCRTKCSYCDFNTYAGLEHQVPRYVQALCAEVRRCPAGAAVATLNFGGGTPSLLAPSQLAAIIGTCRDHFRLTADAEISLEANPDDASESYFAAIRALGVNRLSFGAQSFHASELRMLTRRHTAEATLKALAMARSAGLGNINLDLMYGLPGQTLAAWRENLEVALASRPEHLSLYALTVHEGLPLAAGIAQGSFPTPDDDLAAEMYELAERMAASAGYAQYEISNWSLGGNFPCRHNLAYWRNTGYLGLGAGAHSYFQTQRSSNERSPAAYADRLLAGHSAMVW
ncbi:MAG: radical SAM family heme chaperone HemW, partial [Chloroflexota bacterium]